MLSLIFAASAAASLSASAPVSIMDPANLARFLQSKGYKAELDLTDEAPTITSGASGWTHIVVLHGCENKKACQDLLLRASWDAKTDEQLLLEKVNTFNREQRFVRTYLDTERDPVIEMDVIFTDHAMDAKMLEEHLDLWDQMLSKFAKHIGME